MIKILSIFCIGLLSIISVHPTSADTPLPLAPPTSVSAPPTSISITSTGPRALRDAIQLLEQRLQCVITYEDPIYGNASSIVELYPSGPVVPKQRTVSLDVQQLETPPALSVVQLLLQHNQVTNPAARFSTVVEELKPSVIDVKPAQYEAKNGEFVSQSSLLDMTTSFSVTKTYQEIAEQICQSVSHQSGNVTVMLSRAPTQEFEQAKIPLSCNNLSARSCLDRILLEYNQRTNTAKFGMLSWYLDRDPDNHYAAIRFYMIPPRQDKQQPSSFGFETARPLQDAIQLISSMTKTCVIYEDPPWGCSCEVLYNGEGKPECIRGGILRYSYSKLSTPQDILQKTVTAYNEQINPGLFSSKIIDQAVYVYPTQNMKVNGDANIIDMPLLEHRVSYSAKNVNLTTLIGTLCGELGKQTKTPVTLGRLPLSSNAKQITYAVSNRRVDECLRDISTKMDGNLSWSLLYDPRARSYTLNCYELAK